ncbi:MAG: carbohydrate-binding protein [Roseburia sp.]|nr:hypothetical protein [Anaeroplasma bactoclasticum]MCM1195600.1 carbohydrate-binding protein [Roseburia sp.]MCM1556190.1 hypothetical protein [Anaeroplasma bactoclasticum]
MLKLKIINQQNNELYISLAAEKLSIVYNFEYQDGDWMIVDCDKVKGFYKIRLEDTMEEAIVYVPESSFIYHIPEVNQRKNYSPKSFYGDCHLIHVEEAKEEEVYQRRNMAYNPYDEHFNTTFYPHSVANVETRNECVFASRNAIDGYYYNDSHGSFPYQSWGINKNPNAEFKIDFGREVMIDEVVLTLRADFPHDNYWKQATLEFSDHSQMVIHLDKTEKRQAFKFKSKKVSFIVLKNLIKGEKLSDFPALTQFEAWGTEIKEVNNGTS